MKTVTHGTPAETNTRIKEGGRISTNNDPKLPKFDEKYLKLNKFQRRINSRSSHLDIHNQKTKENSFKSS